MVRQRTQVLSVTGRGKPVPTMAGRQRWAAAATVCAVVVACMWSNHPEHGAFSSALADNAGGFAGPRPNDHGCRVLRVRVDAAGRVVEAAEHDGGLALAGHNTVVLIRHAEAEHNARKAARDPRYHKVHDPHLTELGREQVEALRGTLEALVRAGVHVETVLTSPMTRTLQTMLGAFLHEESPFERRPLALDPASGSALGVDGSDTGLSDDSHSGSGSGRKEDDIEGLPPPPRVELVPLLAEHDFGGAPCDTGSDIEVLRRRFGGSLSFDSLRPGSWPPARESRTQFRDRVRRVARLLSRRSESAFAVVGHGHFMRELLGGRVEHLLNAVPVVVLWPVAESHGARRPADGAQGHEEAPLPPDAALRTTEL